MDDRIPGDRASKCKAMMEPVGVIQKGDSWRIMHHCIGCNKFAIVDSSPQDNFDEIIKLSQKPVPDDFTESL